MELLSLFRYSLKFKPSHNLFSIANNADQREKSKNDTSSKEHTKERIKNLFEGMKEATSADFVSNKYYTVDQRGVK